MDRFDIVSLLLAGAIIYVGLASFGIEYITAKSRQLRALLICGAITLLALLISLILHAARAVLDSSL